MVISSSISLFLTAPKYKSPLTDPVSKRSRLGPDLTPKASLSARCRSHSTTLIDSDTICYLIICSLGQKVGIVEISGGEGVYNISVPLQSNPSRGGSLTGAAPTIFMAYARVGFSAQMVGHVFPRRAFVLDGTSAETCALPISNRFLRCELLVGYVSPRTCLCVLWHESGNSCPTNIEQISSM